MDKIKVMKKKNYFKVKSKNDLKYIELLHCLCIMNKYGFRTYISIQTWLTKFAEEVILNDD